MILNPSECVVTDNVDDGYELVEILHEHGYKFHHGGPLKNTLSGKHGARFIPTCEYPYCIATLSSGMAESVKSTGFVDRHRSGGHFHVMSFAEFMSRINGDIGIDVDDLI